MAVPRKRFAQHWLRNDRILNEIVRAAELRSTDRVLEIGPGTGILTRQLFPVAESVVSVEIDRDLCQQLVKKLGKIENFLLVQGDFLALNLPEILERTSPIFQHQNKVVANIPYNITGPILEKLLGKIDAPAPHSYEVIVLLVQKEVAERLYAKPGSRAFGALSVRVQYLATCELVCPVPAQAFYPPPKVDSAAICLRPRAIEVPASDPKMLSKLVQQGFAQKRKMLRNNLQAIVDRDRLAQILEELGMNSQVRAEEVSVENWVKLSDRLCEL